MRIRIEGILTLWALLGLVLMGCGSRKEAGHKKRASLSSEDKGAKGAKGNELAKDDEGARGDEGAKDDEGAKGYEQPRKRLNCKQGCEKLRTLAQARDKKLPTRATGKARARLRKAQKKARVALVTRCNKECAESPVLASCMTYGDTFGRVFGCLSTPKPPPMTTPATAETKRRCAVFLAGVKTRSACDKLATLLTEVAQAFARVSNKGEFPKADERAIQRCINTSVAVGKQSCKAHRPYKVAAMRLLAATFKN